MGDVGVFLRVLLVKPKGAITVNDAACGAFCVTSVPVSHRLTSPAVLSSENEQKETCYREHPRWRGKKYDMPPSQAASSSSTWWRMDSAREPAEDNGHVILYSLINVPCQIYWETSWQQCVHPCVRWVAIVNFFTLRIRQRSHQPTIISVRVEKGENNNNNDDKKIWQYERGRLTKRPT